MIEILNKLNPWWTKKEFELGIPRDNSLTKIKSYLKSKEILVITGVRRAGKTVLLYQMIHDLMTKQKVDPKSILFVNFDVPDIANLKDPIKTVLGTYFQEVHPDKPAYLVFDEIQNIEGWERWAKSLYDEKKHRLILSGSSSKMLSSKLATLLSGRYLKLTVFPLDFKEFLLFKNQKIPRTKLELASAKNRIMNLLRQYMEQGGFPRIVLEKDLTLKNELLKSYYDTIIHKDIVLLYQIRNVRTLRELAYYLCSNFTSLFSYKKICDVLKLDFTTLKEYMYYLEEARILFESVYYSYSLKAQSRNNKKIYCIDNGLRNAVSFKFSSDKGRLAENLVFVELKRRGNQPFYWIEQGEVDFVIRESDNSIRAINVSYTDDISEREIKALLEFKSKFNPKELILLTKNVEKKEKGISFIPLWKWLLE